MAGTSYAQKIPLNGAGTSAPPPPPPPAIVSVVDNEMIAVTDSSSFPDVFDREAIKVSDQVTIKAYFASTTTVTAQTVSYGTRGTATVSVISPGGTVLGSVSLSVDGGTAVTMALTNGIAIFNLGVLSTGMHTLAASFAAQGMFGSSTGAGTFTVTQAVPVLTWATPAAITYGTTLGSTQLNATASVAGSLVYSPAAGTILNTGTSTLKVSFTPMDSKDYTTASASVSIVVNKASSILGLSTSLSPAVLGQAVTLTATVIPQLGGTATATVTFTDSVAGNLSVVNVAGNVATFSTNTLTLGTHSITASYSGDGNVLASKSSVLTQTIVAFSLSPTSLRFNSPLLVTTTSQTVTLFNGSAPLKISSIAFGGANASQFAHPAGTAGGTCPSSGTLAANANCTINLTFTPAGTGTMTASLNVNVAAPAISQSVSLTGTVPVLNLSTVLLNFRYQKANTSSPPQTLTVKNTGTGQLVIKSILVAEIYPSSLTQFSQTNSCPIGGLGLAPNGTCTINVVFTPTTTGSKVATLVVAGTAVTSSGAVVSSGTGN
jgi:hypothetical protein